MKMDKIEFRQAMLKHYLTAALWAESTDDGTPLDSIYEIDDVAHDCIKQALADCEDFIKHMPDNDLTAEQLGHDLWLTRNGHGAGFWDRGLGDLGDQLTELCKDRFKELYAIVGDDGKIYLEG